MLPKECGFGYLHKLVLPPYAVSMPNPTLWSSCSQNRCRSATLSGELGVIYSSSSTSCSLLVENRLNFQLFCEPTLTIGGKLSSRGEWGHQSMDFLQTACFFFATTSASLLVLDLRWSLSFMIVFLHVSVGSPLQSLPSLTHVG